MSTSPVTGEDGWTEQYGCYTKTFARVMSCEIAWERDGYRIRIAEVALKARLPRVEDAKALARRAIREWCEKGLKELAAEEKC